MNLWDKNFIMTSLRWKNKIETINFKLREIIWIAVVKSISTEMQTDGNKWNKMLTTRYRENTLGAKNTRLARKGRVVPLTTL
jgi:hypothetical protein